LGQNEIARQLSISSTPVREALRRLAGDELVRIDAHRGAVVKGLDRRELEEVYELRLLLEPLATRKAALEISESQLDAAEALCDDMDATTDAEQWAEINREFHALIADCAQAPNLARILRGLRDRSAFYVQWSIVANPATPARANEEHRQIVAACRRRDAGLAAAIEEQHLLSTVRSVMEITQSPSEE
jgi:DNA-binding GntR family transcriptional regulator